MSENTLNVKIIQRGDTEANWTSSNPILLKNEMAISTDKNGRYKIGDGTSTWSALSYSKADPTSHTHTKSQITDFPSSLKNPYALTLQGNGTTLTNGTYDGSAAKTVNITPDSIGASPKEGNTSLSKLASTITLGDGASGTILQNSATYQQKIEILDNSTSGDAVFNFSQSTDSGSNFTSLMQIRDDGNIVANKFTGTLTGNAATATALTTSAGSATQPVYFSSGKPVAMTYTLGKSVPSNAVFTDTTYTAGSGLTLSGTEFKHSNSVTAATAQGDASKTLSFGGTFTVPTVTYDSTGHITGKGTTTMTMPANPNTDTKNTAGSTDTSSKIFLIGATSQAANPQTYSDNEVYTTSGALTTKSVQIGGGAVTLQYNSSTESLDFVFS